MTAAEERLRWPGSAQGEKPSLDSFMSLQRAALEAVHQSKNFLVGHGMSFQKKVLADG